MTKKRVIKAWGGFSDWNLDKTMEYYGDHHALYAVYLRKEDAKKCYEDFRPVTILLPLKPTKEKK